MIDLVEIRDTLENIHRDMCNIYCRYPSDKNIQKATIDIGYLKDDLDKKIEASCDQKNASI